MLNIMERYPEYAYMFECGLLIKILNELCPEHAETLKSLISSGRLEVTDPYSIIFELAPPSLLH